MIKKMCPRCGKMIPVGTKCKCSTPYAKDYNKFRRNNKIKIFRSSQIWMQVRDAVIRRDAGIDQYLYHTTGEIKIGNSVHHIIPISEDYDRRTDPDNLITLSEDTHGKIEYLYKTKQKKELQQELLDIVQKINSADY